MAKSAMPVSKAKTAYGLLSEIRKLILEEPKRYDQTDWLTRGEDAHDTYGPSAPACGTVGCVAGWVVALKGNHKHRSSALVAANVLFGVELDFDAYADCVKADELFNAGAAGNRSDTPDGIRLHAERGAAHIAKFQKKYAAQLKAKRV